jgi:hypothetical protein
VTSSRLVVDGITYAVTNISAVNLQETPSDRRKGIALLVAGVALILIGLIPLVLFLGIFSDRTNLGANIFPVIFISLTVILGGFLAYAGQKSLTNPRPDFTLVLTNRSGRVEAFSSKNSGYIQQIFAALNKALGS